VGRQAHPRVWLDPLPPAGEREERRIATWHGGCVSTTRDGGFDSGDEALRVLERMREVKPLLAAARPVSRRRARAGHRGYAKASLGEAAAGCDHAPSLAIRDENPFSRIHWLKYSKGVPFGAVNKDLRTAASSPGSS
jgi:hypothetical protein